MVRPRTNAEQGVVVLSSDGSELAPTTPAKARKLMDRGRAVPVRKDPFTIKLKQSNQQGGKLFITATGQPAINLDTVCNLELDGKQILFFFTAMTARTNWKFEKKETAEKVYKNILVAISARQVDQKN